jgi:hypothetical protein
MNLALCDFPSKLETFRADTVIGNISDELE